MSKWASTKSSNRETAFQRHPKCGETTTGVTNKKINSYVASEWEWLAKVANSLDGVGRCGMENWEIHRWIGNKTKKPFTKKLENDRKTVVVD